MTKLLLISAVSKPNEFSYLSKPPLGLGYIASYLRKYHGITNICIIEQSYEFDMHDLIRKYEPNIVGISSTTQNYNAACSIADKIKAIDGKIFIVIGGHHITALPHTLNKNMDIGILGEGEETFAEIIRAYEENRIYESKLGEISGIVYWKEGKTIMTNKRNFIYPIDKIPFPARDLFNIGKEANIITSRGCPYRCIYCAASSFWCSIRFHSSEYVVEEIKELIFKYKATHITIEDDLFIANRKRVEQISKFST